jgi:hypothetical protein
MDGVYTVLSFHFAYSVHNVVADNFIGCKPRMDHNEDFSEVAIYLRASPEFKRRYAFSYLYRLFTASRR